MHQIRKCCTDEKGWPTLPFQVVLPVTGPEFPYRPSQAENPERQGKCEEALEDDSSFYGLVTPL